MTKFKIVALDHIVLNVRDVERSLAFYIDVLGLAGERVDEFRAGKVGFPSVRVNDSCLIDLMAAPGDGAVATYPNLAHFCLVSATTDLDELAARLKARGVTVTQTPVSRWGARGQAMSIYFLDPDGNEIEVRCY